MTGEKPLIGQDWADRYPDRFNSPDLRDPWSCPICGHPTGSCTGEHNGTTDTTEIPEG